MLAYAPPATAPRLVTDDSRNPAIDALRGVAILCVVLLHVQIHIPQEQSLLGKVLPAPLFNIVFRSGYYGVIIFFVISGFLITRSSLTRWGCLAAVPWRNFLWRRVARIYPCLLLLLLALAALHWAQMPGFVIDNTPLPRAIAAALTLHLNWLEAQVGYLPAAWNVLWSLSIEEAFYLAFPLICLLSAAAGTRALVLALLLFVVLGPFARVAFTSNDIWADHSYLSGMDGIAIGCLAALATTHLDRTGRRHGPGLLLAGTVMFVLVFFLRKATSMLGLTASGLNVTLLEIGVACLLIGWSLRPPRPPRHNPVIAALRWTGHNSYEIYLTHMFPVLLLAAASCRNSGGAVSTWWRAGALTAACVLVVLMAAMLGGLVARYFSTPMRRWMMRAARGGQR
jgi:peptidoglycan/LPS O-acetylase OafA/YrhL